MQRQQKLLLSLTVWGFVLFYGTTVAAAPTSQEIAKIALGSTVHLGIIRAKGGSTGSGFFVGPNQVATNYHVIEDLLIAKARLVGGVKLVGEEEIYIIEDIVVYNKEWDLAVVKVKEVKSAVVKVGMPESTCPHSPLATVMQFKLVRRSMLRAIHRDWKAHSQMVLLVQFEAIPLTTNYSR